MPENSKIGHARYDVLDGLRGVAAISVMLFHYTQDSFPRNTDMAVDLFFILSGFVIAHSYGSRLQNSMSVLDYTGRRLIRLYPMYIAGIIIGIPVLFLVTKAGLANYSPKSILGNIFLNCFFLPDFNGRTVLELNGTTHFTGELFPLNPPSWSLFFELVASLTFPFLFKLKRHAMISLIISCYAVLMLISLAEMFINHESAIGLAQGWNRESFLGGFPRVFYGFSFGILIYSSINNEQLGKLRASAERLIRHPYTLYLLLLIVLALPMKLKGLYPALILAVVAPSLVFFGSAIRCDGETSAKVAKFLGWISYPIYCLHLPIGRAVFLISSRLHYSRSLAAAISIAATFVVSVILTKFYEEPVRTYLSQKAKGLLHPVAKTINV